MLDIHFFLIPKNFLILPTKPSWGLVIFSGAATFPPPPRYSIIICYVSTGEWAEGKVNDRCKKIHIHQCDEVHQSGRPTSQHQGRCRHQPRYLQPPAEENPCCQPHLSANGCQLENHTIDKASTEKVISPQRNRRLHKQLGHPRDEYLHQRKLSDLGQCCPVLVISEPSNISIGDVNVPQLRK